MSGHDVECVVVGAGVVGLAVARELALAGRETWVLEGEDRIAEGISSRNSGVIHAGLYYPTGSLKARLCVRGRDLMYAYCARRGVPHRQLGKLVVAVGAAEVAGLQALQQRAHANGVEVHWRDAAQARALEPALACAAALEVPSSGIVDPAELALALAGEIEAHGGRVACNTPVAGLAAESGGIRVRLAGGDTLLARCVVNAAGLGAVALGNATEGLDPRHVPLLRYAAGHYYTRHGRAPFSRLIYPMPEAYGLGVHLGFDLGGRCRFGPDLRWIDGVDYHFDDSQHAQFAASVRRWWPELRDDELQPDFVGVRPKITGPGEPQADFRIDDARVHGIPGLVNLFGIESPGLTSSLAIGEEVRQRLLA